MTILSRLFERTKGDGGIKPERMLSHSSQYLGEPRTAILLSGRKGRKRIAHNSLGTTNLSKIAAVENKASGTTRLSPRRIN